MVLIVEDEAISRRALQSLLRLSGLQSKATGSAEEAMSFIGECGVPEMAIVDINLPGMNGLELVRQLHESFPTLPCVLMTANEDAHLEQIRGGGTEPMFRKPFDVSRLLHLVLKTINDSHFH